jgi:hypothetical protein
MKYSFFVTSTQKKKTKAKKPETLDDIYDRMASKWAMRIEREEKRQLRKFRMSTPFAR